MLLLDMWFGVGVGLWSRTTAPRQALVSRHMAKRLNPEEYMVRILLLLFNIKTVLWDD